MADYSKLKDPDTRRIAEGSKPLVLEDLFNNYPVGTNMGAYPGNFIHPKTKVRGYDGRWNISGFVSRPYPDTAFLDDSRWSDKTLLPHEATHVQQNLSERKLDYSYRPKFNKKHDFGTLNAYDNLRELVANLQGEEANMPAGQRWFQKPELANMFASQYDIDQMDKYTYPSQWREGEEGFVGPSNKTKPTLWDEIVQRVTSGIRPEIKRYFNIK